MAERYWVGTDSVDAMYVGADAVDAVYLGDKLIWPLAEEDQNGQASLVSTTDMVVTASIDYTGSATLESTSEMTCRGKLNDDINGTCSLTSTATVEVKATLFEMFVTSTSQPTILSTGGVLIIEEISPNYWHVYSTDEITEMAFDYLDYSMRTDVTEVEVTIGSTLTTLLRAFYTLNAMTDFTWHGACNVTNMQSCFSSCHELVNITLFDTSNVTNFDRCWEYCRKMVDFPLFDTSAALTLMNTWSQCILIVNFPLINVSACENFSYTWSTCTSMESLPTLDTSSGIIFTGTFSYCTNLICIGSLNTINQTDTTNLFLDCFALVAPDNLVEQPLLATGDDWTNSNPCPDTSPSSIPPIYLMTEALETDGVYQFLFNSSASGSIYNGRLEHSSLSNDELEGTPWWPSNGYYDDDPLPAGGWIDLNANGNATRQINTQWIAPDDSEWSLSGIYDVILGTSYKIYTLHYHGDNTVDIYLGSNTEPLPLTPTYTNVPYTPPTTVWIIKATPPEIITVSGIIYEMDSFTTV